MSVAQTVGIPRKLGLAAHVIRDHAALIKVIVQIENPFAEAALMDGKMVKERRNLGAFVEMPILQRKEYNLEVIRAHGAINQ